MHLSILWYCTFTLLTKTNFHNANFLKVASACSVSVIPSFVSAGGDTRTWICRRSHCFHSRELMSKCCLSLNKSLNESIMEEGGLDLLLGSVSWEGLCWETRSHEFNPKKRTLLNCRHFHFIFLFVSYLLITFKSFSACTLKILGAFFACLTEKPACVGTICWQSSARRNQFEPSGGSKQQAAGQEQHFLVPRLQVDSSPGCRWEHKS